MPSDSPEPAGAPSEEGGGAPESTASTRSSAFLLARATLIITTAYMVLAQIGFREVSHGVAALVVLGIASCGIALRVPRAWLESSAVTAGVLVADTVWITALLLAVGSFGPGFFYLYFFILLLAAIGERLGLIALGAVVVCAAYLYVMASVGHQTPLDSATLIRVPFLFTVATFYGYLVDRLRRERHKARVEAASVRRLEEVRTNLEATNRRLGEEVRERRRAEEELRKLSELKSSFVSIVSHELRTPLTSIKNAVDLVGSQRAGSLAPDQVRFLDIASRNLDRLGLIIDDLLDISKIEAGRIEFRFTEVSVRELLEDARDTFSAQAEQMGVELVLEPGEPLRPILGDGNRLSQVVTNLVGNALKFTEAGGRVCLEARHDADSVLLEVADTGAGIHPWELERIFEPFHQAGDCLTRSNRGTGLGLSVARELVWAHGGTLTAASTPGEGSRFTVRLPACQREAQELVEMEDALRQQRNLPYSALLCIRWDASDDPAGRATEEGRHSLLWAAATILRESLPRETDLILVQTAHDRLVLVLPCTPREGAETVRRRLERLLATRPMRIDGVPVPAPRVVGPAMYPDDGPTARALLAGLADPTGSIHSEPRDRFPTTGEHDDGGSLDVDEDLGGGRRAGRGGDREVPAVAGGLSRGDGADRNRGSGYGALVST